MNAFFKSLHWLMLLGATFGISSISAAQTYTGPRCFGSLCIDQEVTAQDLIHRMGESSSAWDRHSIRDGRTILSFFVSEDSEVVGILLTDSSYQKASAKDLSAKAKKDLRAWKTGEDIGLDSSEEGIVKAYGKPTGQYEFRTQENGSQVTVKNLSYRGRVNGVVKSADFTMRNGKASRIEFWIQGDPGPTCLGYTCEPQSARAVFRELGKPKNMTANTDVICYQSEDGKSFLSADLGHHGEADIDVVFLSDFPNCLHKTASTTKNSLSEWKTSESIHLGSSEEEVVKVYGKPTREEPVNAAKCCKYMIPGSRKGDHLPDIGQKVLFYEGMELHQTGFGIRNGRVSFIWISDSE